VAVSPSSLSGIREQTKWDIEKKVGEAMKKGKEDSNSPNIKRNGEGKKKKWVC